jgi:type II secretory pathway component PulK
MGHSNGAGMMFVRRTRRCSQGSILLYVLWILVVISALAFKLSSASRVVMTKQVSEVSQIKKKLQLRSAIQFARFKINSNNWENIKFEQNLNDQRISIQIYNESGFISLYDLSSQSLKNVLDSANISSDGLGDFKYLVEEKNLRFNDFTELTQFEGITEQEVNALIPYVSIYHEDAVNPDKSPASVLLKLEGVDQYRVNKIIESTDSEEKKVLRKEVVEILKSHNFATSENETNYFRLHISLDSRLYRVFLRYDRRSKDFVVVNMISPLDISREVLDKSS